MSWINEEDLKAIKQQADIVDVTSHYLSLTKKGKNYAAICPFHNDHDPSLSISPEKQIYKCFVCGAGGDAISFVKEMEKVPYPEAVYKVADMIHYPLRMSPTAFVKKENPNQVYFNLMKDYIQYIKYELISEDGKQAYSYLESRKINEDIINRFDLGYAPEEEKSLRFLQAKRYDSEKLKDVGLLYDDKVMFHHRFMIPIHDENGNPVGFTARRLNDQSDEPKYINTSETKIYEKGNIVFNYHRAKDVARKQKRCILVEGAMDVLAFEKADIHESIACLGTACTQKQLQLIQRLQVPVYVCYDGDRAGKDATYKFGKMAIQQNLEIQIVKNTTGKDPDEIFDAGGKNELQAFVTKTISWVDFLFEYLLTQYNLDNHEDKKAYAQEIFDACQKTCDNFEKQSVLTRIKEKTGFDFSNLVKGSVRTESTYKKRKPPVVVEMPLSGRFNAERAVLMMILLSKDAADRFKDEIGFFSDKYCHQLSLYCYDIYRKKDKIDIDDLMSNINEEDLRNFLDRIYNDPHRIKEYNESFFEDSILKLKECTIQEQIDFINQKVREVADPLEKIKLANRKRQLIIDKENLRRKE